MSPVNKRLRDRQWDAVRRYLRGRIRALRTQPDYTFESYAAKYAIAELDSVQRLMSQVKSRTRKER